MILNFVGGSGGTGLNFAVVGSLTEPTSPAENTIWVKTETKITGYCFDNVQPEGTEGLVWIYTASSAEVRFNVLKENAIYLRPIRARQYADGEWGVVTARIWQEGEWREWWNGTLYSAGDEYAGITGGWIAEAVPRTTGGDSSKRTVTSDSTGLKVAAATSKGGILRTTNKIDLSGKTSLIFEGTLYNPTSAGTEFWCSLCLWSEIGDNFQENVAAALHGAYGSTEGQQVLDISGVPDGEYYVGFALFGSATVFMTNLLAQ